LRKNDIQRKREKMNKQKEWNTPASTHCFYTHNTKMSDEELFSEDSYEFEFEEEDNDNDGGEENSAIDEDGEEQGIVCV